VVENQRDLYVEGLPPDITMEEFLNYFSKAGIVRKDEETGTLPVLLSFSSHLCFSCASLTIITGFVKAKIYKTPEGHVKGDGLICYYKKESVDLAISILDGAEIKKGHPLKLSVV
jgi:HIV Tat-specific factor 1